MTINGEHIIAIANTLLRTASARDGGLATAYLEDLAGRRVVIPVGVGLGANLFDEASRLVAARDGVTPQEFNVIDPKQN